MTTYPFLTDRELRQGLVRASLASVADAERLEYNEAQRLLETHEKSVAEERGRTDVRSRIDALLDDSTFEEHGALIGWSFEEGRPTSSVVTGLGKINGRDVALFVQDDSVNAGALGKVESEKIVDLMEKARILGIPIVSVVSSSGARVQEGVSALSAYSKLFQKTVELSGVVPQISVVVGTSAGGAVYGPAMTDFIIMVKDSARMFVTGPKVVKAVTGEEVSSEELGGSNLHSTSSGLCDYEAQSEADAFDFCRALLGYLPNNYTDSPPTYDFEQEPKNDFNLAAEIPTSSNSGYDVHELIDAVADHNEFVELQDMYGTSITTGFACFGGFPCGVVANNPASGAGALDSESSEKAARFVQFCNCFNIPILTLVDVPGYLPGLEQETGGIIRRGAKLLFAYANCAAPLITVVIRKGYGGAFDVMGSKSLGADRVYAWPEAEVAVMGSGGAVDLLYRKRLKEAETEEEREQLKESLTETYEKEVMNVQRAVTEGEIDSVIAPSRTRGTIVRDLALFYRTSAPRGLRNVARPFKNMPM